MRALGTRLGSVLLATGLLAGCDTGTDVHNVEVLLAEHYLDPLTEAGLNPVVNSACRYEGPVDAPWHLSISLHLDADADRVAGVLLDEGMVVKRDRDPMIVQQVPDDPGAGWNGGLRAAGAGSVLTLVFNNATSSGWAGSVGWAQECTPEEANGLA